MSSPNRPNETPAARPEGGGSSSLTPLDIQRQQFTRRRLGGLDEDEVYRFLTRVAKDLEGAIVENRRLKEQVLRGKKQLQDYMDLERTLKQTLQSAQRTTGESRLQAEKEAELILKQSELDAGRIVEEAREEARQLLEEVRELKRSRRQLRIDLRSVLDGYLDLLGDGAASPAAPATTAAAPPPPPARSELASPPRPGPARAASPPARPAQQASRGAPQRAAPAAPAARPAPSRS